MRFALALMYSLVSACTPSAKPTADAVQSSAVASVEVPREVSPSATVTEPVASAQAPAPAVPAASIEPTWRGDHCKTDTDCGWDDPCAASRCSAVKTPPAAAVCDKSHPPPGTCSCVEAQCTLRPSDPSRSTSTPGSCDADAKCAIDVATGTCHAGGQSLIGPIDVEGPVCLCNPSTRACEFAWSGPVPCKTWSDCSWVREPRLRAVPSSEKPRPVARPVRPCKDAEVDSVCEGDGPQKYCRIKGWSC